MNMRRYLITILLSAMADFSWLFLSFAVNNQYFGIQVLSSMMMPFINLLWIKWYLDSQTSREKFLLAFFTGIGNIMGSSAVMLLIHNK